MSTSVRIGAAVVAGYVLGRFKKLRLALVVGSALSNGSFRAKGAELLEKGSGGMLSARAANLLTDQVVKAAKGAAVSAASGQMNRVSDRLAERSARLRGEPGEPEEEPEDEFEPEDEDVEERPRPVRASRRRRTA